MAGRAESVPEPPSVDETESPETHVVHADLRVSDTGFDARRLHHNRISRPSSARLVATRTCARILTGGSWWARRKGCSA